MQGPGHNAIRVMATLTRSSSVTSRILPAARRPTPWAHTSRAFSDFSGVDSFAHGNSVRDIHSTAVQQNAPAPHQQDDEPKRVSSSFNSSSTAAGTPAPSLVALRLHREESEASKQPPAVGNRTEANTRTLEDSFGRFHDYLREYCTLGLLCSLLPVHGRWIIATHNRYVGRV
eukprot:3760544-Rhodomonas_salina.1